MEWYYVDNESTVGPVTEQDLEQLAQSGKITSETKVRNDMTSEWKSYGEFNGTVPEHATHQQDTRTSQTESLCVECGRSFQLDEMVQFEDAQICASCKPIFFQKIKEGAHHGVMVYGGFWIRCAAKILDGIILGAINAVFTFSAGFMVTFEQNTIHPVQILLIFLQIAVPVAFATYFVGKFSATPGKMICGLKIVMADSGKISYARALGRHFAEYISSFTLMVGYIMAAFDDQKRSLHDRICNTRVIKK